MTKKYLITTALSFIAALAQAQNKQTDTTKTARPLTEVEINADSKFSLSRKESGRPVIKITREDIDRQAATSVADLLNQYAGIEINGARSNAGQNLGYFIRGGNNRQVSILIDGAQVSDASFISSEFDLRLLDLSQIEEIEILKGASSSLYGANASTAVINIKLREEYKKNWSLSASAFTGTNQSSEDQDFAVDHANTSFYLSGRGDNGLTYGAGLGYQITDGLSAVESPNEEEQFAGDRYEKINLIGRIGYDNKDDFKITSYLSFDEFENDFDGFDFTNQPFESYNRQWRWGTNMVWQPLEKLTLTYNDVSTHTRRDTRSNFPSLFNADGYSLDLYGSYDFQLAEEIGLKTLVGFNYRSDQFESFSAPSAESPLQQNLTKENTKTQIYDPYASVFLSTGFGLNINAGARFHGHENYDGQLIYHLNPSYGIEINDDLTLKLYGSYSTAYITPSLFQLFDPTFGNEDLQPEENRTLEGGIEFLSGNFRLTASYFTRDEENLVVFVTDPDTFASQYTNVASDLTARGIEISGEYRWEKLRASANYTFIERDQSTLLRLPKHKANASVGYQVLDRTNFTFRYQYNDDRNDLFFNNSTFTSDAVILDSYHLLDLDITHRLEKHPLTLFAGISNLLNEEYQELFGYQTRGRNVKVGLRVDL